VPLPCSLEAQGGPSPGPTALTWEARVPARVIFTVEGEDLARTDHIPAEEMNILQGR